MPAKSPALAEKFLHLSRITELFLCSNISLIFQKYPTFMIILPLVHILVTVFCFHDHLYNCTATEDRYTRKI